MVDTKYRIRPATLADAEEIIALRRLMFEEMGVTDAAGLERMAEKMRVYLARAMPAGDFYAWVVEDGGGRVVSAGAVVLRQSPPTVSNPSGSEAYVQNVCTYPEHRRRGLARGIMDAIMEWARSQGIVCVTLRASEQGRPMYERMGFTETHEMRLLLGWFE